MVFITLVSAWGLFVRIRGYSTQASGDAPCSGRFSFWGGGTSITPGLATGKADPQSVHFGVPLLLCPLGAPVPQSPAVLCLNSPRAFLTWHFLLVPY